MFTLGLFALIQLIVMSHLKQASITQLIFLTTDLLLLCYYSFYWNYSKNSNNNKIISYLKKEYPEVDGYIDNSNDFSLKLDSYIKDIINYSITDDCKIESYYISNNNYKVKVGAYNLFSTTSKGVIARRVKGLFVQADAPYNLGKVVISDSQITSLEERASSIIKNRFIPNYNNIPLTFVKYGNSDQILNDRIQQTISDFSSKNKNIGIVFNNKTIFISVYLKYLSKNENSSNYYESVAEEIYELLNTLDKILAELGDVH